MDLGLFWQVISRHRRVVILGLALSVALGFVSMFSVGTNGIERRGSAVWEASSTLLVTQPGFPYGRSNLDELVPVKGARDPAPRFSDPARFVELAALYAQLAAGDEVRFLVRRAVGLPGIPPRDEPKVVRPKYVATSGKSDDGGAGLKATPLPTVIVSGRATSADAAVQLSKAVVVGLRTVIGRQQVEARIAPDSRIILEVIERAADPKVVEPLRPTRSIMLVLLGLLITTGVVFVVDNVKRGHFAEAEQADEPEQENQSAVVAMKSVAKVRKRPRTSSSPAEADHSSRGRPNEANRKPPSRVEPAAFAASSDGPDASAAAPAETEIEGPRWRAMRLNS